jgi:hypothetical protein
MEGLKVLRAETEWAGNWFYTGTVTNRHIRQKWLIILNLKSIGPYIFNTFPKYNHQIMLLSADKYQKLYVQFELLMMGGGTA